MVSCGKWKFSGGKNGVRQIPFDGWPGLRALKLFEVRKQTIN